MSPTKTKSSSKSKSKKTSKKKKTPDPSKKKEQKKQDKKKSQPKTFWQNIINKIKTDSRYKALVIYGAIFLIFSICAFGVLGYAMYVNSDRAAANADKHNININEFNSEPEPLVKPRRIDGVVVATEDSNKIPVCVMIENAAFSGVRPQSGLQAASLVYEIIVEGGITRLMAVFTGEETDPVGPVRSSRDTYLEFASELDCMYTHAGGSFTSMLALQEQGYKDLDALREYTYFWRDPNKPNPHDLFTKTENLYQAVVDHTWEDEPTYDPWLFTDETPATERLAFGQEGYAQEVNIYIGGAYDVKYKYNSENNYYERWNGGVEHIDANTGEILKVNNIIIEKVPPGWIIEGKGRINFDVTGEGEAHIFRQGEHIQGTWKKDDRLVRTKYYDANGNEIEFVRGNSWVHIVPEDRTFDWQ